MTTLTFEHFAELEPEQPPYKEESRDCSCDNCEKGAQRLAFRCLIPVFLASALYTYGMLEGAPDGLLSGCERFACQA